MMLLSYILHAPMLSLAITIPTTHVVHEERETSSSKWTKQARVRANKILPVRIGLRQKNLDNAVQYLMDVSDPASPSYGKHWTPKQVVEAFQPEEESVDAVMQWLNDSGIPADSIAHSDNRGWLAFRARTEHVERLLHTEYYNFENKRSGGIVLACDRYHVPRHIQQHVDYINPGVKLLAPIGDFKTSRRNEDALRRGQLKPSVDPHTLRSRHDEPRWWKLKSNKPRSWAQPHRTYDYGVPAQGANLSTCDKLMMPACIAALYSIPPAPKYVCPENSMGIFEAQLQYWDQPDLDTFFTNITHGAIPNGTHPIDRNIDGGVAKTTNVSAAQRGGEGMLDIGLAYPIVFPQTITVWNVDDLHYQAWDNDTYSWGFNSLLDAIDGSYCTFEAYREKGDAPGIDPPYPDPGANGYNGTLQCGVFKSTNVLSLSYASQEVELPIAYQKRQCLEFLKLGLQGVSIFFSSGDSGVGDSPAPFGQSGPTGCLGTKHDIFNPQWPNNCPWVTNVGATKVYPGKTVFDPESAAYDPAGHPFPTNYSSGGGFSNLYGVPDYQKAAIATYFAEHDPGLPYYSALVQDAPNPTLPNITALAGDSGGIYNRIGRGIPDVAAVGDNIPVQSAAQFAKDSGTSASTPIFAAIINRINEERLHAGKSTVGFINPVLYKYPEVLNDITNGTNKACLGDGFEAVKGWDPVTGLGTPNFPKMLELWMKLP